MWIWILRRVYRILILVAENIVHSSHSFFTPGMQYYECLSFIRVGEVFLADIILYAVLCWLPPPLAAGDETTENQLLQT